jgi:hypothetical protein
VRPIAVALSPDDPADPAAVYWFARRPSIFIGRSEGHRQSAIDNLAIESTIKESTGLHERLPDAFPIAGSPDHADRRCRSRRA